jgi:hypothetical protein
MANLHSSWIRIAQGYDRLWSHTSDGDAEDQLAKIIQLEWAPSELATTDAPNDQKLLGGWQDRMFSLHRLTVQDG